MAIYKTIDYLVKSDDKAFDALHDPGDSCPLSGIYRCENCHHEVASNQNQPLPPQNHFQHDQKNGPIKWRLVVFAQHKKS
jgi:hypothetical protein